MANLKRGLILEIDGKNHEILKVSKLKDTIVLQPIDEKIKFEFTLSRIEKRIEMGNIQLIKEKKNASK